MGTKFLFGNENLLEIGARKKHVVFWCTYALILFYFTLILLLFIHLILEFLGHRYASIYLQYVLPQSFPKWLYQFILSLSIHEITTRLAKQTFDIVSFILAKLVYIVMFYCGFNLCRLDDQLVEHFLILAIWIFSFGKHIFKLLSIGEAVCFFLPSFFFSFFPSFPFPPSLSLPPFFAFFPFFLLLILSFFLSFSDIL